MTTRKKTEQELINDEEREHFLNAENDSDSESDEKSEQIRIIAPRRQPKKGRMEEMLMEQLLTQQKNYLKAQKKIYELQTEIDTEEVKTRYLILDLNNAQVKADTAIAKLAYTNKVLFNARVENWAGRVLFILYLLSVIHGLMV